MRFEEKNVITFSEDETIKAGYNVAMELNDAAVVALYGDLGTGKTCFVKGIAIALGINDAIVSPTFTLVREYSGSRKLYHIDLYRMRNIEEIIDAGIIEYINFRAIVVIEWADRLADYLPSSAVKVKFYFGEEENQRKIYILKPIT